MELHNRLIWNGSSQCSIQERVIIQYCEFFNSVVVGSIPPCCAIQTLRGIHCSRSGSSRPSNRAWFALGWAVKPFAITVVMTIAFSAIIKPDKILKASNFAEGALTSDIFPGHFGAMAAGGAALTILLSFLVVISRKSTILTC